MRTSRDAGLLEVILIMLVVGGPIALVLYGLYQLFTEMQLRTWMTERDFLLIQPDLVIVVFIAYGLALLWFFLAMIYDDFFGLFTIILNKLGVVKAFLLATFLFVLVLAQLFFTFTRVSADGIERNYGGWVPGTTQSWNEIKKAVVYYDGSSGRHANVFIHYELEDLEGERINLKDSFMFWDRIPEVDQFLQSRGVPIDRGLINDSVIFMIQSKSNTNYDKVDQVIQNIFQVSP